MARGLAAVGVVIGVLAANVASAQQPPAPLPPPTGPAPRMFPAPNYQLFRTDVGFGGATILDQEAYGGNISIEPKFNALDNLALGARVDVMIGGGGDLGGEGEDDGVSVKQHVAVGTMLKADYFLTRGSVRPWVGVGLGRYAIVGQDADTSGDVEVKQNAGSYFGVAPQVGVELGGFRLSATYNKILGAEVEVRQQVGGEIEKKKYSQDYVTFELGFRIGGRRR